MTLSRVEMLMNREDMVREYDKILDNFIDLRRQVKISIKEVSPGFFGFFRGKNPDRKEHDRLRTLESYLSDDVAWSIRCLNLSLNKKVPCHRIFEILRALEKHYNERRCYFEHGETQKLCEFKVPPKKK